MRLLEMVDDLVDLVIPDDANVALGVVKDLITLRNVAEHQLAVCAAVIDESGIARKAGSTTSKLFQANGAAPVAAYRWMRIGPGLAGSDRTAGYSRDGFLSSEHVDAVAKGVEHVVGRSEEVVTAEQRVGFERKLLSHAISGAPPSEINMAARALGNEVAKDTGGPPPAEDRSLNSLEYKVRESRCVGTFDVDAVIGEKLFSALDLWSRARPEPDGSDDPRSPTNAALTRCISCWIAVEVDKLWCRRRGPR